MTVDSLIWFCQSFHDLDNHRLYAIIKLRQDVFVVEQDCVYADLDDLDQNSLHMGAVTADGDLLCYARCLPPGLSYSESSIGRIAVSESARGLKLGRELVSRSININREHWPGQDIKIGAQAHLEHFYNTLGFDTISEPYDEDGIMHIKMLLAEN